MSIGVRRLLRAREGVGVRMCYDTRRIEPCLMFVSLFCRPGNVLKKSVFVLRCWICGATLQLSVDSMMALGAV